MISTFSNTRLTTTRTFIPALTLLTLLHVASAWSLPFVPARSLPLSPLKTCPCAISVSLRSRHNLAISEPFDLLVVRRAEWERLSAMDAADVNDINYVHRYSILSTSRHQAGHRDERYHHFYHPRIQEAGEFAVVVRSKWTTLMHSNDYGFHFEAASVRSEECPVVLDTDIPSSGRVAVTANEQGQQHTSLVTSKAVQRASNATIDPRIVGGDFINPNLQGRLAVVEGPAGHCTGSIISATWVLTAAHCGVTRQWQIVVGASQAFAFADGTRIGIKAVFNHESWRSSGDGSHFDISLVELLTPAPTTNFIRLNENPSIPERGSFARVMGYGVTSFEGAEASSTLYRLRQVDVPTTPISKCENQYNRADIPIERDFQICAGYAGRGGCDSCQGDSGGPMIQYDLEGNPVQIGIVSFGIECARPDFPGVYVRTDPFRSWMASKGAVYTPATQTRAVFAEGSDRSSETNVTLIAGAAIGGIALTAAVITLGLFLIRKHRNNDNDADADEAHDQGGLGTRPTQEFQPPPSVAQQPYASNMQAPAGYPTGPQAPPPPPPPPASSYQYPPGSVAQNYGYQSPAGYAGQLPQQAYAGPPPQQIHPEQPLQQAYVAQPPPQMYQGQPAQEMYAGQPSPQMHSGQPAQVYPEHPSPQHIYGQPPQYAVAPPVGESRGPQ